MSVGPSMTGVCVTTCVSPDFQHYIPLWTYCLNRAYPEYSVKVFCTDSTLPFLRHAAKSLNVQIIDKEFGPKRYEHHPPRFAAWCRFLLFTSDRYHYWKDHEWVYITDADLMIVRQNPPLHEQHISHMKALGLCYSNLLRRPKADKDKYYHMTGLHFCGQDFIRAVMQKTTEYDGLFRIMGSGVLDGKPFIYDERLLYQIVRDSKIGLPPTMEDWAADPSQWHDEQFRPWHGINIGRAMVPDWHKTFQRAKLPWFQNVVKNFVSMADAPAFWENYAYLTPSAKKALGEICRVSGHELRRKP